jgi:hypothetical protein
MDKKNGEIYVNKKAVFDKMAMETIIYFAIGAQLP